MTDVACDACCLINVLAAGSILPLPPAARHLVEVLHVPDEVAGESLYILQASDDDPNVLVKIAIDLSVYFNAGLLTKCHVDSGDENTLYVQLATQIDDGEAACLAIAKQRKWSLATDDRPATRLAQQLGVPVINTAQLLKSWATSAGASSAEITVAISNVQRFAHFVPRIGSSEADWWYAQCACSMSWRI